MKNNKGFLLVESLVVSTFVLTVLIFLYIQFNNLMVNHKKSYTYNSVENIYNLGSMSDFLRNTNQDITLKTSLSNHPYILLYDGNRCVNLPNGSTTSVCNNLAQSMNLKYMIYTDSNIDSIKEYAKNYDDANLKQDMRDFILKVDATRVDGKGRLFAKFGVSNDSSNDKFATVAIDTNGSITPNSSTITYSFYKFNDLNIWRYSLSSSPNRELDYKARENFTINSFDEASGMNDITVNAKSGWESVYIPLSTISNTEYTIYFDYRVKSAFNPLTNYTSVEVQALKSLPENSNCRNLQTDTNAGKPIKHVIMNQKETYSIKFTASSTTTYLNFNFGMAADNQVINLELGNFRLTKELPNGSTFGNQLSPNIPGHSFSGWYTEKEGGTEITENTPKYSPSNQVLYAREE